MKNLIIALLFLLPITVSAQLLRSYGVVEIGSTFPTSSTTGAKYAYRPVDSSFYRWVSGNTWVKVVAPSIQSDTLYLTQASGTTLKVNGDTINLVPYLLKSDTTSMLSSYINLAGWGLSKLTKTLKVDSSKVASRFYVQNIFLAKTDTAAMLAKYIERGDTAAMLSNYPTFGDVNTSLGNYLPILGGTLTGTGGAGFIGLPSQVTAPGTPASGLNIFAQGSSFNWKGTDGFERQITSSLTGGRNYALPDINGTFALGTGTTDRLARWTATNTLAAGNLSDNATRLQALLPWQFHSWTTAGRPTGVLGYTGFNSSNNYPEFYNGSTWDEIFTPWQRGSAYTYYGTDLANTRWDVQISGTQPIGLGLIKDSDYYGMEVGESASKTGGFYWRNSLERVEFTTNSYAYPIVFGNEWMYLGINGRVGFGTIAPAEQVELSKNSNGVVRYSAQNLSTGTSAYTGFIAKNATGFGSLMKVGSGTTTYKALTQNSFGLYNATSGDMYFLNDWASGVINFSAGASSTPQMTLAANGNLLLGTTTDVSRRLHVTGEARITDLTTDSPTRIVGADADGDLGAITLPTGGSISSGILTMPWLKTELEAGQDVNISGASSTDFRIQNTRIQFDNKFKIGSDSLFQFNPITKEFIMPDTMLRGFISGSRRFLQMKSGLIIGDRGDGTTSIDFLNAGGWSIANSGTQLTFASNLGVDVRLRLFSNGDFTFGRFGYQSNNLTAAASGDINLGAGGVINLSSDSTSSLLIDSGTIKFNAYGIGAKEAADLSKTQSNYIAGFATDGTVLDYPISSLSNGIYTGSGTLASSTTRALVSPNNKLLFTQKYNTTDSAFIQMYNVDPTTGNRSVVMGLTDTVHSGGISSIRLEKDEVNDAMTLELKTIDDLGTSTVNMTGNSVGVTATDFIEHSAAEIRLNDGEVLMNQYGQDNMKSTDLSVSDSKFVAKFATNGKVTDYYLARDTFIEDITLFSVGTLMYDCQELTIVSSMTALASTYQEIRFPDAADHLRGKKIIVYSKKRDGGTYVPYISVVGGVSRLYYTTNPAVGGTDPSSQATLYIDDGTWSDHGTTFEFTCLKIDNTPNYRWVLKQR